MSDYQCEKCGNPIVMKDGAGHSCHANDSGESACSVPDWQVAHSARYILEDLNNHDGMTKLADLTGLPVGVIVAAFNNFFPPNDQADS